MSKFITLLLSCLLLAGCGLDKKKKSQSQVNQETSANSYLRKYDRGPLHAEVKIDKKELTIAERINLSIVADVDENYDVELPAFGAKLEQFGIVDFNTDAPKLVDGGKVRTARHYKLEPFLSGEYTIPSLTINFTEKDGKQTKHELKTEPVTIKVNSLHPDTLAELKIADITAPVELPPPPVPYMWIAIGCAVFLAGIIILIVILKKRKTGDEYEVIKIPAHEIAFRELKELASRNYIEDGEYKLFYHGVSDILRRYIENRFGMHAPEQTTEEFLLDVYQTRNIEKAHQELLKDFLEHCDQVKFAAMTPDKESIQKTFDSCKKFIMETMTGNER